MRTFTLISILSLSRLSLKAANLEDCEKILSCTECFTSAVNNWHNVQSGQVEATSEPYKTCVDNVKDDPNQYPSSQSFACVYKSNREGLINQGMYVGRCEGKIAY